MPISRSCRQHHSNMLLGKLRHRLGKGLAHGHSVTVLFWSLHRSATIPTPSPPLHSHRKKLNPRVLTLLPHSLSRARSPGSSFFALITVSPSPFAFMCGHFPQRCGENKACVPVLGEIKPFAAGCSVLGTEWGLGFKNIINQGVGRRCGIVWNIWASWELRLHWG